MHPLCESFIAPAHENSMEEFFPLRAYVCPSCFLVQLEEYVSPSAIFTEYAYFSSYSASWLDHARKYVKNISESLSLGSDSFVVEVGSNDGYLLRNFVDGGVPCLGIDPADNVAKTAKEQGVPTKVDFFGVRCAEELAAQGVRADLICGSNVMAQVPDLNDFVEGLAILLGSGGTITIEFPHLLRLMDEVQFDTVYHEHFYYFSLLTLEPLFARHGLRIFDVDRLETHGGSLRIHACEENDARAASRNVELIREEEDAHRLADLQTYARFGDVVAESKRALLDCLISVKREGSTIAAYGAPGKGNTLLNYCGIGRDFVDFAVDRNEYKWGRFTPGTHIPIHPPERLAESQPDYVLILPWNLREEIMSQQASIRDWGGKFIVPIPAPTVIA